MAPLFVAVNSYTTGLSPAVMEYILKTLLCPVYGGETSCDEIGLPVSSTGGVVPCGATALWLANGAQTGEEKSSMNAPIVLKPLVQGTQTGEEK